MIQTQVLSGRQNADTVQRGGRILRGSGPPSPVLGNKGAIYIDITAWGLYVKRDPGGLNPWGYPLFTLPVELRASLNFFGSQRPDASIGVFGDYYAQWSECFSGVFPIIYGPRQTDDWGENGSGPTEYVSLLGIIPIGLADEGALLPMITGVGIDVGLLDEAADAFAIHAVTTPVAGFPVVAIGLVSVGELLVAALNPLAFANAEHAV